MLASSMLGGRRGQLERHPSFSTMGCVVVLSPLPEPLWVSTLSFPTQSACPTCLHFKNKLPFKNTYTSCHAHQIHAISAGKCHWTKRRIHHSKKKRQDGSSVQQRGCPEPQRRAGVAGHVLTQASHASRLLLWRPCTSWPRRGGHRSRRCEGERALAHRWLQWRSSATWASRRELDLAEAARSSDAQTGASLLDRALHAGPVIVIPSLETWAAFENSAEARCSSDQPRHIFLDRVPCNVGAVGARCETSV